MFLVTREDRNGCVHTAAFPPCLRIRWPASEARGWVDATMPPVLWTTLRRLGKGLKRVSGLGWTACAGMGLRAGIVACGVRCKLLV
jgi:hypothetical protein